MMVVPASMLLVNSNSTSGMAVPPTPWSGKVIHIELYITDGYINVGSGASATDPSNIAGWLAPVYMWGFTDIDPGGALTKPAYLDLQKVPPKARAVANTNVGNMKYPSPFLEANVGDDVYITVHNRGFFQNRQAVQDEHTLHLHGIHAQSPYDGFPESAGGYVEQLKMFWRSAAYGGADATRNNLIVGGDPLATYMKDIWWNSMDALSQQAWIAANAGGIPLVANKLSAGGGIPAQFDLLAFPVGTPAASVEAGSQFTYYFRAEHPGTYMYHCHITASEHVQMGMYGAIVLRPKDYMPKDLGAALKVSGVQMYWDMNNNNVKDPAESFYTDADANNKVSVGDTRQSAVTINLGEQTVTEQAGAVTIIKTVYGVGTGSAYDKEYTFLLSEIDPIWHGIIERGVGAFYPPNWKPQIWNVNGRSFPSTVSAFAYQVLEPKPGAAPGTKWYRPEPRYNTYISITPGQVFLTRWINMGYQDHPMHQHGWHFDIIGSDAMPYMMGPISKFTLSINSGETYDTLTLADPVYGSSVPAGSPLAQPGQGGSAPLWNQVYPIHDHDDYRVTNNGLYPGGALILMEATVAGGTQPTWVNPYTGLVGVLPFPPPGS
jgi:hypothetical protein